MIFFPRPRPRPRPRLASLLHQIHVHKQRRSAPGMLKPGHRHRARRGRRRRSSSSSSSFPLGSSLPGIQDLIPGRRRDPRRGGRVELRSPPDRRHLHHVVRVHQRRRTCSTCSTCTLLPEGGIRYIRIRYQIGHAHAWVAPGEEMPQGVERAGRAGRSDDLDLPVAVRREA